jgi:flagellar hook-associated protein 1 FlgK
MSGITAILDNAARALSAEQLGVEVTGHNLANVNTKGYSRQSVDYVTAYPEPSPWGPLGRGVKVQGIERAFDPFITARLNDKSSLLADYQTRSAALQQVATFFNETQDGGLNDLLSQFFAAWHDLANNPTGAGERQTLLSRGLNLAEAVNSRADQLVQERLSLLQQVGPTIDEINSHSARIAELTREIVESEANGHTANDLRDQRDLEIAKLSELVGVRTYTTGDGNLSVTLPNGLPLVQGVLSWNLTYQLSPADTVELIWQGPGGINESIPAGQLTGGKLAALIQTRDELIPKYQQDLDQLARDIITAINNQHSQGVGLELFSQTTGTYQVSDPGAPLADALPLGDQIVNGSFQLYIDRNGTPLVSGSIAIDPSLSLNDLVQSINTDPVLSGYVTASIEDNALKIAVNSPTDTFGFANDNSHALTSLGLNTFFTGDKAYTFGVNAWVLDNPDLVAAGQIDASGAHAVGDNRNALALAALEKAPAGPDGLTFAEAYERLVMNLGLDAQDAQNQEKFFQGLVDQLTQMRDAVSGVSLDEELTNLVKFQRAYQAAARLVSVADELYQTLLNLGK